VTKRPRIACKAPEPGNEGKGIRAEPEAVTGETAPPDRYACFCGRLWPTIDRAKDCRRCRRVTSEGRCPEVIDVFTRRIVWEAE